MTASYDVDDIAPPSGDSWQPEIGDKVAGKIISLREQVRDNKFGKTEKNILIFLEQPDGSVIIVSITVNADVHGEGYPKRNAKAVGEAIRQAGAKRLEEGANLAIARIDDYPSNAGPAQDFKAKYVLPEPVVEVDEVSLDDMI
jgi:hypothetical protein